MDYRPKYHASVRSGWGNDPNGLIFYNNLAHMFFQYNPYAPEWGPMHWGHFTTEDFVHWKEEPIALCPDREYEQDLGCWSGTSMEVDGKLCLAYTCSRPGLQRQCLAISEDGGLTFRKFDE
ncbi:MAG: glycoside hydrolase family 32 protein, partial [bacterium]